MIIFPAMKLEGIKANNRLKKFIFEKFKFENKYIFFKIYVNLSYAELIPK